MLPLNRHKLFKVLKWVTDGASGQWEPGMEPDPMANVEETTSLKEAHIISSESNQLRGFASKHMVMFDCDVPVMVIPSSTPGHSHIYFPRNYVSKDVLFALLDSLAVAGIVEPGYVAVSKARGFAALRLPWVHKTAPAIRPF